MRRTLSAAGLLGAALVFATGHALAQDPPGDEPSETPDDTPIEEDPVIKKGRNLRAGGVPLRDADADSLVSANAHVTKGTYGRSRGNRPLEFVEIRSTAGDGDIEWKALLIARLSGARPTDESKMALHVAAELAEKAAELPAGTAIQVIWDANPDATAWNAAHPSVSPRAGNDAKDDDDRDGSVDEDGPDDVDGDGVISWMRVPDPTGDWHVPESSEGDPLPMGERADAQSGKPATHRIVLEGRDNDDDDLWNEDGPGGADLSVNFPFRFAEHTPGHGAWAASEPETRALIDHLLADERIALVYEFGHTETLAKPAPNDDAWPKPPDGDRALLDVLRALHGQDGAGKDGKRNPRAPAAGGLGGTVVHQLGRLFVARAPLGRNGPDWPAKDAKLHEGHTIEWTPLRGSGIPRGTHIGKLVVSPTAPRPSGYAAKNATEFLMAVAGRRARVAFAKTRVSGEPGILKFRTRLVNSGGLPTHSERGAQVKGRRPVNVWLRLPDGAKLLAGEPHAQIERIDAGGESDEMRFLIQGASGSTVRVEATSPDAGTTTLEVQIP